MWPEMSLTHYSILFIGKLSMSTKLQTILSACLLARSKRYTNLMAFDVLNAAEWVLQGFIVRSPCRISHKSDKNTYRYKIFTHNLSYRGYPTKWNIFGRLNKKWLVYLFCHRVAEKIKIKKTKFSKKFSNYLRRI